MGSSERNGAMPIGRQVVSRPEVGCRYLEEASTSKRHGNEVKPPSAWPRRARAGWAERKRVHREAHNGESACGSSAEALLYCAVREVSKRREDSRGGRRTRVSRGPRNLYRPNDVIQGGTTYRSTDHYASPLDRIGDHPSFHPGRPVLPRSAPLPPSFGAFPSLAGRRAAAGKVLEGGRRRYEKRRDVVGARRTEPRPLVERGTERLENDSANESKQPVMRNARGRWMEKDYLWLETPASRAE
ncbi:hypothetical protein KM043_000805 [Ampulex compressa]|nr:hypothetical protein KM043_000805 [Ampulex compressa]